MSYSIVYKKQAVKDAEKLKAANLNVKARTLIDILRENPFQNPPPYEKLSGEMYGAYSRRINSKHRLVYRVFEEEKTVKILRLWTHYENL